MKKAAEYIHNISNKQIFTIGLFAVIVSFVPYIILGMDSIIPYHDQLDGEMIAYIYQAKYLFSGNDKIPEFLNGASKTALIAPAPLAVLLFKVFPPFTAYMFLQMTCQLISYIGMYFCIRLFTDKGLIALITALLFTYISFLPVYGLAQYGAPMLLLSIYYLYSKKHTIFSYIYIALYSAMSSLVLCGFAWMGVWLLGLVILATIRKLSVHREMVAGFAIMFVLYVVTNISLLGQVFGITAGTVSHKTEYVLNEKPLWSTFIQYLKYNDTHSADHHIWILYMVCAVVAFLWIVSYRAGLALQAERKAIVFKRNLMTVILAVITIICFAAAIWDTSFLVQIRKGALGSFQFNRLLWIVPPLWYLELGLCLEILWSLKGKFKWFGFMVSVPVILYGGFVTLQDSMLKPCLKEILLEDYETISFSDYYAIGVMDQVEAYLEEAEGLSKSEYKVASLGIDPAAALYHGFYCVDGYSNNYDLEYKHSFRKVIEPELERNEWLKNYYDTWGNRCYLFFSEIPGYYNIERNSFWFNDLQLNTAALKELGCDYILSAAYIVNAEENALELMREEPFNTDSSYYQIFIYKIGE